MTSAFDKNAPTSSVNDRIKPPAPVFEIDQSWYETDEPIPRIWVTEPVFDSDGEQCGRTYGMPYPWEGSPDPDGSLALNFGADYYREAMSYSDAADRQSRIDCFRTAEILYLHAAARGNVDAHLNLGYIYSYDRCEGHYYVDHRRTEDVEDYMRPYPREERAFECFSFAAEAGDAEACYKLGDLHKHGTGCEPNADEAFAWYARAFELKDGTPPHIWGSIALRLADAYENGIGCTFDLQKALDWYKKAEAGLDIGVRSGATLYNRTLANVRAAIKRIKQELSGAY